jgi:hypothetical protein
VPTLATATASASALSLVGASLNGDSDPEAGSGTGVCSFGLPFPLGAGFGVFSDLAFFFLGCLGSLSEAELSSSSSSSVADFLFLPRPTAFVRPRFRFGAESLLWAEELASLSLMSLSLASLMSLRSLETDSDSSSEVAVFRFLIGFAFDLGFGFCFGSGLAFGFGFALGFGFGVGSDSASTSESGLGEAVDCWELSASASALSYRGGRLATAWDDDDHPALTTALRATSLLLAFQSPVLKKPSSSPRFFSATWRT